MIIIILINYLYSIFLHLLQEIDYRSIISYLESKLKFI